MPTTSSGCESDPVKARLAEAWPAVGAVGAAVVAVVPWVVDELAAEVVVVPPVVVVVLPRLVEVVDNGGYA